MTTRRRKARTRRRRLYADSLEAGGLCDAEEFAVTCSDVEQGAPRTIPCDQLHPDLPELRSDLPLPRPLGVHEAVVVRGANLRARGTGVPEVRPATGASCDVWGNGRPEDAPDRHAKDPRDVHGADWVIAHRARGQTFPIDEPGHRGLSQLRSGDRDGSRKAKVDHRGASQTCPGRRNVLMERAAEEGRRMVVNAR